MGNMNEGDVWKCDKCQLELQVTKACDEEQCDLMCCGQNMSKQS